MLDDFPGVIKEEDFCWGDKQYIAFHIFFRFRRTHAVPVKKKKIPDVDVFAFVEVVAAKGFDEYVLVVIPEGKSVIGVDKGNPLLDGMDSDELYLYVLATFDGKRNFLLRL